MEYVSENGIKLVISQRGARQTAREARLSISRRSTIEQIKYLQT